MHAIAVLTKAYLEYLKQRSVTRGGLVLISRKCPIILLTNAGASLSRLSTRSSTQSTGDSMGIMSQSKKQD